MLDEVDRSQTAKTQEFMEMMAMVQTLPPELVNWAEVIRSSTFANKEEMARYAEQMLALTMGIQPGENGGAVNLPQSIQGPMNDEQNVNSA